MFFIPNGPHLAVIIEPNEHFDLVLYFKSDIYNPMQHIMLIDYQ